MSEQHNQIKFSDPRTFRLIAARSSRGCSLVRITADFSANGQLFFW